MFGPYAIAFGRGAHRQALDARARMLGLHVRGKTSELLLVAGASTSVLKGARSLIVGQIFNGAGERLQDLPAEFEIWATKPRACPPPHDLWGNFAYFFASCEQATVYREPSGSLPVYHCRQIHEGVFVSDAQLGSKLGLLDPVRIDEQFIVHWLQFPFLRTRRTGVEEVTELLPGMILAKSGEGPWRQSCGWHPSFVAGKAINDPAEAVRKVRSTALGTVGVQPEPAAIALTLSGGLDSSIIAACLAQAKREFCCINFATRSRDGDEREHAREVARAFRARLIEIIEPEPSPLEVPDQLSFQPLINPLLHPFETAIGKAAQELGALQLVDGGGGDNLFCSVSSAAPLIDAMRSFSLRAALAAVRDIAARANCNYWEVLMAAMRRLARPRPPWKEDRSFLNPAVLLVAPDLHPWLQHLFVPPGKREHIEALVHIQHFLDRSGSPIERIHPLLAQPLLELCLQVPSWLWLAGGRDRAVAREAFKGLVPASVLQRRVKGSLQGMLYRSFARLRGPMRELLVTGELAARQVIDPRAIEDAFLSEAWMRDEVQLRISEMVALELWLRSWQRQIGISTGHNRRGPRGETSSSLSTALLDL